MRVEKGVPPPTSSDINCMLNRANTTRTSKNTQTKHTIAEKAADTLHLYTNNTGKQYDRCGG